MNTDLALISQIQRFSLHDGPGIRTTLFFKGCPLRCLWCQNPESLKSSQEIAFYSELCQRCFSCLQVCTQEAILGHEGERIDRSNCTDCGDCAKSCVFNALRLIGHAWDANSLLAEVLKDKDFFDNSRGGITLSGGEPMLYYPFLREFLPLLKSQGVHVNMETSGAFRWEEMEALLPHLDLVYFDLKLMDPEKHRKYTRSDNKSILENFSLLSRSTTKMCARIPLVPGINNDKENILATAAFLGENKHAAVHCLPYHGLGEAKLKRIRSDSKSNAFRTLSSDELLIVRDLFRGAGIDAAIIF